jgi:tetratricopeptide (TPR) repeat protein
MNSKQRTQPPIFKNRKPQVSSGANVSDPRLAESAALAWAAILARKGKLIEAQNMLLPIANQPQAGTSAIDLLAKVYIQQKKIDEAQRLWLRAIQLEPNNMHFLRALLGIAKLNKQKQS